MVLDKVEECCNFAVSALDGVYGWSSEIIAIVIFVFFFNFLAKRFLRYLHDRFKKQNKFLKDCFVQAIYLPISYFVWFFAAIQAIDLIATEILDSLPVQTRHVVIAVGALVALTWFLLRWKSSVTAHLIIRSKKHEIAIDQGKIGAIDKLVTIAIFFFMAMLLMEVTDRSINTIIAFGSVGGLALAFASQEVIANFFGGFMIYFTQPFTIGDWVMIPDHKIEGIVEEIGWYMTRIRSLDKKPIYIPNSIFSKLIIITPSRMSHRQIKETIKIAYEDSAKLKVIMFDFKEMLLQHLELDRSQSIIVRLSGFAEYSFDVLISAYTQTIDNEGYLRIKEDVLLKITAIMEKHGAAFSTNTHFVLTENLQFNTVNRDNPLT